MKVCVIGIGNVGSAVANNIIITGSAQELYLVDTDRSKLEAEFLEFKSLARILGSRTEVIKTIDIPYSDIYIMCAGRNSNFAVSGQKPNAAESHPTDRMALYAINRSHIEPILKNIAKINPRAILFMATNPSNELSKVALDYLHHVVAIGNLLDNARYKDSHLYGRHENPKDYYTEILKGKGFTNWGVAGEVLKMMEGFR